MMIDFRGELNYRIAFNERQGKIWSETINDSPEWDAEKAREIHRERERKKCIAGYNLIIIWELHVFGIRLTIFTQAQRARSCAHIKYSLTTIEIGTFL